MMAVQFSFTRLCLNCCAAHHRVPSPIRPTASPTRLQLLLSTVCPFLASFLVVLGLLIVFRKQLSFLFRKLFLAPRAMQKLVHTVEVLLWPAWSKSLCICLHCSIHATTYFEWLSILQEECSIINGWGEARGSLVRCCGHCCLM